MSEFCPTCQKVQLVTIGTPSVCTICKHEWKDKPKYKLSENDRRFLHSIRIAPEA